MTANVSNLESASAICFCLQSLGPAMLLWLKQNRLLGQLKYILRRSHSWIFNHETPNLAGHSMSSVRFGLFNDNLFQWIPSPRIPQNYSQNFPNTAIVQIAANICISRWTTSCCQLTISVLYFAKFSYEIPPCGSSTFWSHRCLFGDATWSVSFEGIQYFLLSWLHDKVQNTLPELDWIHRWRCGRINLVQKLASEKISFACRM